MSKNQFGFLPWRSTREAIYILRRLTDRYVEHERDLHRVFIDLEKTMIEYLEVQWLALQKQRIPCKHGFDRSHSRGIMVSAHSGAIVAAEA